MRHVLTRSPRPGWRVRREIELVFFPTGETLEAHYHQELAGHYPKFDCWCPRCYSAFRAMDRMHLEATRHGWF